MADRRVAEAVLLEPRLDILEHLRPQHEQLLKQFVEPEFGGGI